MLLEPQGSRRPIDPTQEADPAPQDPAHAPEIDLERAAWDPDYRRQVLEILRRGRHSTGSPRPVPPDSGGAGEKQP